MDRKRHTIFCTPVVSTLLRWLSLAILKVVGWRAEKRIEIPEKCVMIACPHTSNWDFAIMLVTVFALRLDVHWMGKHTLFPWYASWLMKYLGGIPIDRRASRNTVEQMVDAFNNSPQMVFLLTPEGTRSKVSEWKGGFYHIACGAKVPIVLGTLHSPDKHICIESIFEPSGDYEADLPKIKAVYKGKVGLKPEFTNEDL